MVADLRECHDSSFAAGLRRGRLQHGRHRPDDPPPGPPVQAPDCPGHDEAPAPRCEQGPPLNPQLPRRPRVPRDLCLLVRLDRPAALRPDGGGLGALRQLGRRPGVDMDPVHHGELPGRDDKGPEPEPVHVPLLLRIPGPVAVLAEQCPPRGGLQLVQGAAPGHTDTELCEARDGDRALVRSAGRQHLRPDLLREMDRLLLRLQCSEQDHRDGHGGQGVPPGEEQRDLPAPGCGPEPGPGLGGVQDVRGGAP
mmetsp:Transcript_29469/g.83035  ORF Transcript_29469/g.83035 Transcript_29469/m.83035 type:complete len:252 (-) Transcript_29469:21-776(-)